MIQAAKKEIEQLERDIESKSALVEGIELLKIQYFMGNREPDELFEKRLELIEMNPNATSEDVDSSEIEAMMEANETMIFGQIPHLEQLDAKNLLKNFTEESPTETKRILGGYGYILMERALKDINSLNFFKKYFMIRCQNELEICEDIQIGNIRLSSEQLMCLGKLDKSELKKIEEELKRFLQEYRNKSIDEIEKWEKQQEYLNYAVLLEIAKRNIFYRGNKKEIDNISTIIRKLAEKRTRRELEGDELEELFRKGMRLHSLEKEDNNRFLQISRDDEFWSRLPEDSRLI